MDVLNMVFLALAVGSIVVSIFFGLDARSANKKARSLSWPDVVLAAGYLGRRLRRTFAPDLIFAPDSRGGIIGYLIKQSFAHEPAVMTGETLWKDDFPTCPDWPGYTVLETPKWYIFLPDALSSFAQKKVLIVDDLTMSGDSMLALKNLMRSKFNVADGNIKTCTLLVTETAVLSKKAPDLYWKSVERHDFSFPWGSAR